MCTPTPTPSSLVRSVAVDYAYLVEDCVVHVQAELDDESFAIEELLKTLRPGCDLTAKVGSRGD